MTLAERPSHSTRRYEFAVAGFLFLAATLYFAYAAAWSYMQQSKAHSIYIPVTATVIEVSVRSSGGGSSTHGRSFAPHIVYHYSVHGEQYESDRFFFAGRGWPDFASAKTVVDSFKVGGSVQAYVDADHPAQAVLDNHRPELGMLAYLLPMAIFGFGVLLFGLRTHPGR